MRLIYFFNTIVFGIFSLFCFSVSEKKSNSEESYFLDTSYGKIAFYTNDCSKQKKILVMVHGSPGDHLDYDKYLENEALSAEYCIITLDRMGYGESEKKISFPNIFNQSNAIKEGLSILSKKLSLKPEAAVYVGHSYGGPIALLLSSADKTPFVKIILLASPLDPKYEEIQYYNKIMDLYFFKLLIPKSWEHSNDEMLTLKEDLKELSLALPNLPQTNLKNITIFHGEKDWLVPLEHSNFFDSNLRHQMNVKKIIIPDENHFLPWTQKTKIIETILESRL